MREAKIVWVAGMARSGSMWTYNIVRELVALDGNRVFPAQVPKLETEVAAAAGAALRDADPRHVWVLKTHHPVADSPRALFVAPRRDLRDAMVSVMRFMRLDPGIALRAAEVSARLTDHYRETVPDARRLDLDYRETTAEPTPALLRIAAFLGIAVDADTAALLVARYSKEAVRARLDRLQLAATVQMVGNADGSSRLFDPATGFQGGHVSDYRDGDWQRVLPRPLLELVDARLGGWLARYGYPPTFAAAPAE
ncbi:MAG: sulfotransferase domain-containing protein [Geminicoccaceae bacterium]